MKANTQGRKEVFEIGEKKTTDREKILVTFSSLKNLRHSSHITAVHYVDVIETKQKVV